MGIAKKLIERALSFLILKEKTFITIQLAPNPDGNGPNYCLEAYTEKLKKQYANLSFEVLKG